jgi:hypothetical protein
MDVRDYQDQLADARMIGDEYYVEICPYVKRAKTAYKTILFGGSRSGEEIVVDAMIWEKKVLRVDRARSVTDYSLPYGKKPYKRDYFQIESYRLERIVAYTNTESEEYYLWVHEGIMNISSFAGDLPYDKMFVIRRPLIPKLPTVEDVMYPTITADIKLSLQELADMYDGPAKVKLEVKPRKGMPEVPTVSKPAARVINVDDLPS